MYAISAADSWNYRLLNALRSEAVDIIAAGPELSNIIPRLGRCHLLMFFMAATDFIMAGSAGA